MRPSLPAWQRVIFSSSMLLPWVFGHLLDTEVHLVNDEHEIRTQPSAAAINNLSLHSSPGSDSICRMLLYLQGCCWWTCICLWDSAVHERPAKCAYKSLIILFKKLTLTVNGESHVLSVALSPLDRCKKIKKLIKGSLGLKMYPDIISRVQSADCSVCKSQLDKKLNVNTKICD